MKKLLVAAASALGLTMGFTAVQADPGIIFDMGGKFDKSFNEAAYNGAERWKNETGGDYAEFEITNPQQREQAMRRLAERGANPIVAVGFAQADAMGIVAKEFPDVKFAIVDMVVGEPNVQSVVYKEHEGSFLVGALAALASKSGTVSFVGGMDIPLIRRFACGYEQGAKYINPSATVIQNMTGTTPTAWNDPAKGGEITKSQIDRGADVVYAAAGGTGVGVYQAAKDSGVLAIGVDSNQNYLHPGTMLTSMLKRVDLAVYDAFKEVKPGISALGLAEDGVGWALDEHNESLITDEMKSRIEGIKARIIIGELAVHDYMSDNTCTY